MRFSDKEGSREKNDSVVSILFVPPTTLKAQERGEVSVFGGYSYSPELFDSQNGWKASISGNVMTHLALVGDFSGYYRDPSTGWFGCAKNTNHELSASSDFFSSERSR